MGRGRRSSRPPQGLLCAPANPWMRRTKRRARRPLAQVMRRAFLCRDEVGEVGCDPRDRAHRSPRHIPGHEYLEEPPFVGQGALPPTPVEVGEGFEPVVRQNPDSMRRTTKSRRSAPGRSLLKASSQRASRSCTRVRRRSRCAPPPAVFRGSAGGVSLTNVPIRGFSTGVSFQGALSLS